MLNRWNGEEWKVLPQRKNDADIWIPIPLRKRNSRAHQDDAQTRNLAHELAVADVYCAMFPHRFSDGKRVLEYWERDKQNPAFEAIKYDARLKLFGNDAFLEVERCNHPILDEERATKAGREYYKDSLNYKLDRYLDYFKANGYKPFAVLITLEDWSKGSYDPSGIEPYFEEVAQLLRRYISTHETRVTFLVARHRDVVGNKDHTPGEIHNEVLGDPFGAIWYSAEKNAYVRLQDV
jgi:hypothetical protein